MRNETTGSMPSGLKGLPRLFCPTEFPDLSISVLPNIHLLSYQNRRDRFLVGCLTAPRCYGKCDTPPPSR